MAIDTAAKRRAASGVPFIPLGIGITPNAAKDDEWRAQAAWGYRFVGSAVSITVPLATMTVTGYAPTINTGVSIDVPLDTITITGLVPSVETTMDITVDVPLLQIGIGVYQPTITAAKVQEIICGIQYEVFIKNRNGYWERTRIVFTGEEFGEP